MLLPATAGKVMELSRLDVVHSPGASVQRLTLGVDPGAENYCNYRRRGANNCSHI